MAWTTDLSAVIPDGLLERHAAFWQHRDLGKPLVRVRPDRQRERFENVDMAPDMLDVELLTPEVGTRDMRKWLVQGDLLHTECAFSRIPWMEAIVGCEIHSGTDEAMWPRPALGANYEGIERIVPKEDNPWLVKLLALTRALVEANDASYLVTHTLQRGPADILSALLGDVRMGLGFYDEPEAIRDVLAQAAQAFIMVARAQYDLIPPFHGGWCPWAYSLWAPGTVVRVQTDSSSQLSPHMYREQILPHDRTIFQAFDYSIIDLHSAGTFHLYKVLLECDELNAISVTMDPYENAPTLDELIPAFSTILETKSLAVFGQMAMADVERLIKALPSGCLSAGVTVGDTSC